MLLERIEPIRIVNNDLFMEIAHLKIEYFLITLKFSIQRVKGQMAVLVCPCSVVSFFKYH